jgi:hypothetical protein
MAEVQLHEPALGHLAVWTAHREGDAVQLLVDHDAALIVTLRADGQTTATLSNDLAARLRDEVAAPTVAKPGGRLLAGFGRTD